jgi:hypothetical protein
MSPRNGPSDKSNSNRTANVIATIPIAGILVAAALLSGFSSMIGSETAIAQQQNMTSTNATAANATAANATAANATAANATAANATAANATAANATGNQIATGSNQTGAATTECDPSYPDFCIPPPPPNLNCDDISGRGFTVLSPDPHGLDGNDNDGIGCES